MDYGKIVSTGWKQAWQHKSLWIFGFFISGSSVGYMGNVKDHIKVDYPLDLNLPQVGNLLAGHVGLILFLAAVALLAFLIWVVFSTISVGGLIDAAGQLKRGETYTFGRAFKIGAHYFWRIFGIGVLAFIVGFAFVIMLIIVGYIAFRIATALGFLSLLILTPLLIIGIFILIITLSMAHRYIVLQDRNVFDAIADGFNLWKSHLGPSLLYTLMYIAIGIGIMMGTFIVIAFAVMPFIGLAFVNLVLAIVIGVPVVLLILLIVDGLTGSAMHLMSTEFYFQLLEEGKPVEVPPAPDAGTAPPPPPPPPPPLPENP
jgi:hypothetical protein